MQMKIVPSAQPLLSSNHNETIVGAWPGLMGKNHNETVLSAPSLLSSNHNETVVGASLGLSASNHDESVLTVWWAMTRNHNETVLVTPAPEAGWAAQHHEIGHVARTRATREAMRRREV
ncbi:hypothetical protein [Streptomyces sirii]|uniref:hypothetical protein n=1 Tax=Streptomyces sirii TaxID=3127701 RepID=UPI003D35FBD7